MPYNTRRKSVSLAELGITVPKRSRAVSHPTPPSTIVEGDEPPVKKSKRSHESESPPSGLMSPPRTTTIRFKEEKPTRAIELSPPPSPGREGASRVDIEGINDDIVVGSIQQLERTGNKPHLVKELAAILATNLHSVEKSANPSALISSRLTAYLNRSWPAVSPCPLAKDLSPIHPRRLYFYLTTTPHQPIPEVVEPIQKPVRIISPPLSSASATDEQDERYNRARTALSPSPEVDLSSPDLDDTNGQQPPTPGGSFSARNSVPREHPPTSTNLAHNRRAVSPQLEREERDFKQTANQLHEQMRQRRNSQDGEKMEQADVMAGAEQDSISMSVELGKETEESLAMKDREVAAQLFAHAEHLSLPNSQMVFSSPVIQPQNVLRIETHAFSIKPDRHDEARDHMNLDMSPNHSAALSLPDAFAWDNLQSPEHIELAELEDMFDAY